jgi:uncharacterized membrane protein
MNRRTVATATLSAAFGIALAATATAQGMGGDKMEKASTPKMEHCYGINAAGKNDCAAGAHSCAGQASMARDPKSFVLLPAGVCGKIAGGKTSAA